MSWHCILKDVLQIIVRPRNLHARLLSLAPRMSPNAGCTQGNATSCANAQNSIRVVHSLFGFFKYSVTAFRLDIPRHIELMSLDIVVGPMFAGKSSYILSLVSRHNAIGTPVLVIKHSSDTRYAYSETDVVTHDQRHATCSSVDSLHNNALRQRIRDHRVIIVDEAQFFDGLVAFVKWAVDEEGKQVYLMGLDGDSNREVFGEILECIPLADRIQKLTGFCKRCANGTPGIFTHRNGPDDQQVIVGGLEMYEVLCRECYLRA